MANEKEKDNKQTARRSELPSDRDEGAGSAEEDRKGLDAPRAGRRPRGFLFVAILLAVIVGVAALTSDPIDPKTVESNFYKVVEHLRSGSVDPASLEVVRETEGTFPRVFRAKLLREHEMKSRVQVNFATEGEVNQLRAELDQWNDARRSQGLKEVDWKVKESSAQFWRVFWSSVPWIIFLVILYFVFMRQIRGSGSGGNVFTFGRSRAKLVTRESSKVTLGDVAGVHEGKEEVQEIIQFLKNPRKFQVLGGRIPRGVLLVGAPGTGKTLLAKAIAGEADVPFYSICGSDFVEMFVGVGASRVRDLFRQARENSPCIVFLDEVDAVGRRRGTGLGGGHDEREQTLNAILVEMDGFDSDEGVILIAATNRPDVLDPALLRPGRFDRQIVIDLPDLRGREEILAVHVQKVKLSDSVDLSRIARATPGFSGAELAALVNEAAIIAAMNDQENIVEVNLEEARDKLRWGRQKKSRILTEADKRITAYHEAGHALVAHLLDEVEPLHKVTIIPRGRALGATMQLPEQDRYHLSRKQVLGNLMVLYAGRIAEELFCDDVTSGASNDIERATELARRMVCEWGMSSGVGPLNYSDGEETLFLGREVTRTRNHSETIALRIDEEVRNIVDECYRNTEKLVKKHRGAMERITEALMAKETLTGAEVALLVEGNDIEGDSLQSETANDLAGTTSAASSTGALPVEKPKKASSLDPDAGVRGGFVESKKRDSTGDCDSLGHGHEGTR